MRNFSAGRARVIFLTTDVKEHRASPCGAAMAHKPRVNQAARALVVVETVKKTVARHGKLGGDLGSIGFCGRGDRKPVHQIEAGLEGEIRGGARPVERDFVGGRRDGQFGQYGYGSSTGMIFAAAGGAAGDAGISVGVVADDVPLHGVCDAANA